jgi:hypothetical protein
MCLSLLQYCLEDIKREYFEVPLFNEVAVSAGTYQYLPIQARFHVTFTTFKRHVRSWEQQKLNWIWFCDTNLGVVKVFTVTYVMTFEVMLNVMTLFYMKANFKSAVRCRSRRLPLDSAESSCPQLALRPAVSHVSLLPSSDIPRY